MTAIRERHVDPGLVLLARASAWLVLIEEQVATIDEALEALAPAFDAIMPCTCDRECVERWERDHPPCALPWRSRYRGRAMSAELRPYRGLA
jgi:hypothetical protein